MNWLKGALLASVLILPGCAPVAPAAQLAFLALFGLAIGGGLAIRNAATPWDVRATREREAAIVRLNAENVELRAAADEARELGDINHATNLQGEVLKNNERIQHQEREIREIKHGLVPSRNED